MEPTPHSESRLRVDVWSDISCPWCYIGKRTLDLALANFDSSDDVAVTYRSFIVSPDAPADYDGSAFEFLVRHKGIPADQVKNSVALVAERAAAVGLSYDLERISVSNSAKAHEALHYAKNQNLQLPLVDRLFNAFFADGFSLNSESVAHRAGEIGLDHDKVLHSLDHDEFASAVRHDIDHAHSLGIRSVPAYVVNGERPLIGVQTPETFHSVLTRLHSKRQQSTRSSANDG